MYILNWYSSQFSSPTVWHHTNWNDMKRFSLKRCVLKVSKHFTQDAKDLVVVLVLKVMLSCVRKRLHMCLAAPLGAPLSAACIPQRAVFWDAYNAWVWAARNAPFLVRSHLSLLPCGHAMLEQVRYFLSAFVCCCSARVLGLVKNCAWEPRAPSSHTASKNIS
jgi:hypothetical protein